MSALRTAAKIAAWSAPVIALAVATPATAASVDVPEDPSTCGGTDWDNGTYTVFDHSIVIQYDAAPDIYEVNVRTVSGASYSYGTNYGTAPAAGSLTWTIALPDEAAWAQVHGFNSHFGEVC